ncbi:MAG TPA: hypothetical protein GX528_05905, partial [Firmicutes bacterium]|nr:hypothetical protein [Bacillota bacterium]
MRLKDERGSALVLTIIIMLVLLVLGSALALNSLVEVKQAEREERHLQAYYLARSGADAVACAIENHPEEFKTALATDDVIQIESEDLEQLGITVSVIKCSCQACTCRVESKGCAAGCECTVVLELSEKCLQPKFDKVIVAAGEGCSSDKPAIVLSGGATIIGDVATNAAKNDTIKMRGGSSIEGNLFVGRNADPDDVVQMQGDAKVTGILANINEEAYYPEDFWPDFPVEYDDDIVVNSHGSLNINLNGGVCRRRVENFEIGKGGTVENQLPIFA